MSRIKKCPICNLVHDVCAKEGVSSVMVGDEEIPVTYTYNICGDHMWVPNNNQCCKIKAHDVIKARKGLLTWADIDAIFKRYMLSPELLAQIMGCGAKTIRRYETNTQSPFFDIVLRKIRDDPAWVLCLLEEHQHLIKQQGKYRKIVEHIKSLITLG